MSKPKALTNEELKQLRAIVRRTSIKGLLHGCARIVAKEISECERLKLPASIRYYQKINRILDTAVKEIAA